MGAVDIFVKLFKEGVCLFVAVEMVGNLLVRSRCWNRERPNKRVAKLVYCMLVLVYNFCRLDNIQEFC